MLSWMPPVGSRENSGSPRQGMNIILFENQTHVLNAMPGLTVDCANLPALCYAILKLDELPGSGSVFDLNAFFSYRPNEMDLVEGFLTLGAS